MKPLFVAILFCFVNTAFAQSNPAFETFANRQDSLMVDAYYKRDVQLYENFLNGLLGRFQKLQPDEQTKYQGYVLGAYYNLACTYALLKQKGKALDCLEKSKYTDYQHLLEDADLDILRQEKRFKACLEYAKKQMPDYLGTLKKAAKYNLADARKIPEFAYQSSNDPNMVALRKGFNLDSIAGFGNEVSRILNLLHWMHDLVPHDGNHDNPTVKNAMSMVATCKKEGRGLNCRGLATVLNECYLSMGYPSRMVTCMPKDSTDPDCHVINMVFCSTLDKWIWVDPTWDAYVMDENGTLLGIEEVRARLVNGKPLILNPDANWNHRSSATKETYLYSYMAKNLYLIICPISSEYDYETKAEGKIRRYNALAPLDYNPLLVNKDVDKNMKHGVETYYTNDPVKFWAKPPRE